jgi:hypothetical protein
MSHLADEETEALSGRMGRKMRRNLQTSRASLSLRQAPLLVDIHLEGREAPPVMLMEETSRSFFTL